MKTSTFIFAIAITTNTLLAQNEHLKPKQFPKETATRDQVQKWIDSTMLYNDTMQDVWKKQNEIQKVETDSKRDNEVAEINRKSKAEYAKKNYEVEMAALTKDIEEADFIFQGILIDHQFYEAGSDPYERKYNMIGGEAYVFCNAKVFEIFRKNANYSIGGATFKYKTNNKRIAYLGGGNFTVKNGVITNSFYYTGSNYFSPGMIKNIFTTLDSCNKYFERFKNLDMSNEYLINSRLSWPDLEEYCKKNKFTYSDFLKDLRKQTGFKKKLQQGLRNSRIEATTNTTFGITDFYPKNIRAGLGERLTIVGFGFGNTFNPRYS